MKIWNFISEVDEDLASEHFGKALKSIGHGISAGTKKLIPDFIEKNVEKDTRVKINKELLNKEDPTEGRKVLKSLLKKEGEMALDKVSSPLGIAATTAGLGGVIAAGSMRTKKNKKQ